MANSPRIIRTLSFFGAHDPDAILAAADAGMDAIGLDMEDSTPYELKQRARDIFRSVAKELHAKGVIVMARTNGVAGGMAEADLEAIVCPELHAVNMPKAESAEGVAEYCRLLDKAEANNGLANGHTLVRPVVETAAGVKWAYEIASASPRIAYMGGVAGGFWGDLGASIGIIQLPDGIESLFLRSKVLVDVRTAGVPYPIGGGTTSRRDVDAVREFAIQNKHLGYTGHFCPADPELVAAVNEVFTPTKEEIADWVETVPLLEEGLRERRVVFKVGDRMYDTAGLPRVRDQLELARRVGLLD